MTKITLDEVIEEVGNYKRQKQNEFEFQCPYCVANGGDRHGDNLKFNKKKGILYCFADPEHSKQIFQNIIAKRKDEGSFFDDISDYEDEQIIELTQEQKQYFYDYAIYCNEQLLNSPFMLDVLEQIRGINADTVEEVLIGYDNENCCWTIPTIKYSTSTDLDNIEFVGFEYRPANFAKGTIKREKGTPCTLAMINEYSEKREILAVVEGYFDGYALFQYLKEKNQIEHYHIVTCSNGVHSLLKQIALIDFAKYKKFYLFIDNDNVSRPIAAKIIEKYPFFNDIVLNCGCKDFNEHYIKCIKKGEIIDTSKL